MNRNKSNLKRKTAEESEVENEKGDSLINEGESTKNDEDEKQPEPKKPTSKINPDYARFVPPPISTNNIQRSSTFTFPSSLMCSGINDPLYPAQPGMHPSLFLEIYKEYERLLQQLPSGRVFSPQKMRELLPFEYFFSSVMRIIQMNRQY